MRAFLAGLLVVVGLLLLPLANLGIWTQRTLLSTSGFTSLGNDVLAQPAVRSALANRLADELEQQAPVLRLGRSFVVPAVEQVIQTPQFDVIFDQAVGDMHAQLTRGDEQLTLNLGAILPLVKELVAKVNGTLASAIPSESQLPAFTVVKKSEVPQIWQGVDLTRDASWLFPILSLLAFAGAVLVAKRRDFTLIIIGLGTVFVALVLILGLKVGRDPLSDVAGNTVNHEAFDAGYDTVTSSFIDQTIVLGLLGVAATVGGIAWNRVAAHHRPAGRAQEWA
jgi:hypothetical protein